MDQALRTDTAKTVIIVEDEPLVRDLLVCELEDDGFKVLEFDTADAALPYLRRHGGEGCVVVTDVQMPGTLNGLQLADLMSHLWPRTPVLITSGGAMVEPSRLPPGTRFLRKPWYPAEVVERVRSLHAVRLAS